MSASALDVALIVVGLAMCVLWLAWTGWLCWIVTAALWRRESSRKPQDHFSAKDGRFLRSLHIRL